MSKNTKKAHHKKDDAHHKTKHDNAHAKHETKSHANHEVHHHSYKKEVKTWKTISIVAAILFVVTLVLALVFATPQSTGMNGDYNKVGEETVSFLEDNFPVDNITLTSVKEDRGTLKHVMDVDGNPLVIHTSLDGGLIFIPGGAPIDKAVYLEQLDKDNGAQTNDTAQQTEANVAKADKPVVEAFVMSHCPYGTQMEKGLLPVAEVLGDSIDFEIKFVNYAMHGEKEIDEQTLQYCIQKDNPDVYQDYLSCFLEDGNTDRCLAENNLTKESLQTCVTETDEKYDITASFEDTSSYVSGRYPKFLIHDEENKEYGVKGSPTLVINGEVVSSSRDSASLLNTICSSFNNEPEACNTELSSSSPSPGFGYAQASASGATTAQCG